MTGVVASNRTKTWTISRRLLRELIMAKQIRPKPCVFTIGGNPIGGGDAHHRTA